MIIKTSTLWPLLPIDFFYDTNAVVQDCIDWVDVGSVYPVRWISDSINWCLLKLHDVVEDLAESLPHPLVLKIVPFTDIAWILVDANGDVPEIEIPEFSWHWKGWYLKLGSLCFGIRFNMSYYVESEISDSENWWYEVNGVLGQGTDFTPTKKQGNMTLFRGIGTLLILALVIYAVGQIPTNGVNLVQPFINKAMMSINNSSLKSYFDKQLDSTNTGSHMNTLKQAVLTEVAKALTSQTIKEIFGISETINMDNIASVVAELLVKVKRLRGSSYGS